MPEVREKLVAQGTDPVATRPEEFARQIRMEIDKWGKLITQLGLKLEQ